MSSHVNLDALITSQDFDAGTGEDKPTSKTTIDVRELERDGFFYSGLRKPDFQRETSEWEPKRVAGLIKTFLEDDLIPAVILWRNRDIYFVIDGSHRLSALIAWIHDDYGDGDLSQAFWGHSIPDEQLRLAKTTRDAVEKEFGSYKAHRDATLNPGNYDADMIARARRLGTLTLPLQWVKGNAETAEASFIRINRQAANITPQELELIESRKTPPAIVARAIIQKATGHQHWSTFTALQQKQVKELAVSIHELVFSPSLRYPIKTLDLPCGGAVYSSTVLRMVYDLVRLCERANTSGSIAVVSINLLKDVKRLMQLMCSNAPLSVGIHPAVYFYSWTGRQHPILFLSWAEMLLGFEECKGLDEFTKIRGSLEDFLVSNRPIVNQVIRKYGTKDSGKKYVKQLFDDVIDIISHGTQVEEISSKLKELPIYSYLQPEESPYSGVSPTKYSTQVKSGLVVQELLQSAKKCSICGGFIPSQAISVDHKIRKADGGASTRENAQLTHPYCNTGFKEKLEHERRKTAV